MLACALLCLLSACQPAPPLQGFAGLAQGTSYRVSFHATEDDVEVGLLQQAIETELRQIDRLMSNYRDDSVIQQFNHDQGGTAVEVGVEIVTLLRQAEAVAVASAGCYDPGILPLRALWGFADGRLRLPGAAAIEDARAASSIAMVELVDASHLRKQAASVALDLSSIAQGYTAQRMGDLLEQHGVVNYIAEIGGEMVLRGSRPDGSAWQVAIQHPASSVDQQPWSRSVSSRRDARLAIATSGSYRHHLSVDGQRYSHIIDARSGWPVQHATVSVTVQHEDAALADAWSTALLCLGRERGMAVAESNAIAALFIEQLDADGTQPSPRYVEAVSSGWRDVWSD
ncbi:MAG: FAD:protein FMN transferase [Wenzhouxiangellaceae bacterium]